MWRLFLFLFDPAGHHCPLTVLLELLGAAQRMMLCVDCRQHSPLQGLFAQGRPILCSSMTGFWSCRCRACEACTTSTGSSQRRCLIVRATAAAAAGHAGAQLAVLGDKAVGAKVKVWWPLDEDWYTGLVSDQGHRVTIDWCALAHHAA